MYNFKPQITYKQWLSLPFPLRKKLVEKFDIPRSGSTEVLAGKLICDGYLEEDLVAIAIEKMQTYLGEVDADYFRLLNTTLNLLAEEKNDETKIIPEESIQKTPSHIEELEAKIWGNKNEREESGEN
jgi:hypothetical protein